VWNSRFYSVAEGRIRTLWPSPVLSSGCGAGGPDAGGVWNDDSAWLGHRRLAIVDLSDSGRQPMTSSDGRYVIVFQRRDLQSCAACVRSSSLRAAGRGHSDTETLVEAYRAWGNRLSATTERDCSRSPSGIGWERKLFVARDRLGVKPLYYSWRNGVFAFASRPGALTELLGGSQEIDPQALRIYLELGYIPAPASIWQNVRKLNAAHYLLIDGQRAARHSLLGLPAPESGPDLVETR